MVSPTEASCLGAGSRPTSGRGVATEECKSPVRSAGSSPFFGLSADSEVGTVPCGKGGFGSQVGFACLSLVILLLAAELGFSSG